MQDWHGRFRGGFKTVNFFPVLIQCFSIHRGNLQLGNPYGAEGELSRRVVKISAISTDKGLLFCQTG